MTIVITTTFPDEDANHRQRGVGGLGSFRKLKKRFRKITKPISRIAKPLLSMTGGGGGLLTTMGPWGWAAGAAMAAGGALADRHRQKKLKRKQRKARRAAMAQAATPEVMPADGAMPQPAQMPEQMDPQPGLYPQPEAAAIPTEPPAEDVAAPSMSEAASDPPVPPPESPRSAVMVLPSDEPPEVQAVLDPEPVTMAGLGNAPGAIVGIDWRILSVFAGFTLGTWWLLSDRRPTPRSRRR